MSSTLGKLPWDRLCLLKESLWVIFGTQVFQNPSMPWATLRDLLAQPSFSKGRKLGLGRSEPFALLDLPWEPWGRKAEGAKEERLPQPGGA